MRACRPCVTIFFFPACFVVRVASCHLHHCPISTFFLMNLEFCKAWTRVGEELCSNTRVKNLRSVLCAFQQPTQPPKMIAKPSLPPFCCDDAVNELQYSGGMEFHRRRFGARALRRPGMQPAYFRLLRYYASVSIY